MRAKLLHGVPLAHSILGAFADWWKCGFKLIRSCFCGLTCEVSACWENLLDEAVNTVCIRFLTKEIVLTSRIVWFSLQRSQIVCVIFLLILPLISLLNSWSKEENLNESVSEDIFRLRRCTVNIFRACSEAAHFSQVNCYAVVSWFVFVRGCICDPLSWNES